MVADLGVQGGFTRGKASVAFGTVINLLIPPRYPFFTRMQTLEYTAAGTAHTITVLRPLGVGLTSAAAASGQAVVNLVAQPSALKSIAANDWVAWDNGDGTFGFDIVASVSTLAITLTNSLTKTIPAGAKFWQFGITTTANTDGFAHPQFSGPASTTKLYQDLVAGVVASLRAGEPLLVQSNNITATGTIERAAGVYTSAA